MRLIIKKSMLMLLSFAVALTSIFALGTPLVYAGGDYDLEGIVSGSNGDGTVNAGAVLSVSMADLKDRTDSYIETLINQGDVVVEYTICETSDFDGEKQTTVVKADKNGNFNYKVPVSAVGKYVYFITNGAGSGHTEYSANTSVFQVKIDSLGDVLFGKNKDGSFYSGDEAYVYMSDIKSKYPDFETQYNNKKVTASFYAGTTELAAAFRDGRFYYIVHPNCYGKDLKFVITGVYAAQTQSIPVSTYIDFTVDKNGKVTVTGKTNKSNTFQNVKIDNSYHVLPDDQVGKKEINFSFSVTNDTKYTVGEHELSAGLSDSSVCVQQKKLPVSIYVKPAISKKWFETEKNYLVMDAGSFNSAKYGDIYIDYKKGKNGKWSTAWGPFSPNNSAKVKGLSPGSTYYVRAYYVKQSGGSYYIGPVSNTVAIKTGPKKKPAVKSVTISKAQVKKVWVKPILNFLGFVVKEGYYTYKTTYKVTIKFKKKPGIAGIEVYAGGVTLPNFIKGNKKTYTTTFTVNGKAKGKKTRFKIRTKGNKTYGAWSSFYKSKKVTIK